MALRSSKKIIIRPLRRRVAGLGCSRGREQATEGNPHHASLQPRIPLLCLSPRCHSSQRQGRRTQGIFPRFPGQSGARREHRARRQAGCCDLRGWLENQARRLTRTATIGMRLLIRALQLNKSIKAAVKLNNREKLNNARSFGGLRAYLNSFSFLINKKYNAKRMPN